MHGTYYNNYHNMKNNILSLLAIAACLSASAQWNFDAKNAESFTGSYKDVGKKATAITSNFAGEALAADDDNSSVQQIGFDFKFNGQTFNTFVLNTNGFIKLGSAQPSSKSIYYTTQVGGGSCAINVKDSNLLYAFNRNMIADKSTEYRVATTGNAGARISTIQFKSLIDKINPSQYSSISFQIKLYEGSNIIEFVYDEWTATDIAGTLSVAAVGIKGNDVANSVNVAKGSSVKWDETMNQPSKPYEFRNGDYDKKGPNYGNKNSVLPEAGHVYRFKPLK
jgi:hypothetical protein